MSWHPDNAVKSCLSWSDRIDLLRKGCKMSKLLRGLAAGWGAKKLGGGCLATLIIFLVLWWLLGHFGIFK